MTKFLKFLIGILLLPVAYGFSRTFVITLLNVNSPNIEIAVFFFGMVVYMFVHIFFYKPFFIYTLAHELVHAISAVICGAKVSSFHVSEFGGSIKTSKTNIFIELSPYFVPLYTLILLFLIPVVRYNLTNVNLFGAYLFITGFTLGMHLLMNVEILKVRQSDITKSGYVFSIVFIYLVNIIIVFSIFAFLTKEVSMKKFVADSLKNSYSIYSLLWHKFVMR